MLKLVIGDRNISSWSLRSWLTLKMTRSEFVEIPIRLRQKETKMEIARYSPSGKVPVLIHKTNETIILWESLAICEYIAELFPHAHLWPESCVERAVARSVATEMHAGFIELRKHMPMDIANSYPDIGRTPEVIEDIQRITTIWDSCRRKYGKNNGPFLFGKFTVADAMYAPIVTRFITYAVPLSLESQTYVQAILSLPPMQQWITSAVNEVKQLKKLA